MSLVVFIAIVAALVLVLLPPAPRQVRLTAPLDPLVVKGAIHIHTTRSDGGGTVDDVAAAAARAGLAFVVITDHGDGRARLGPSYRSGVLSIDGSEISTDEGHLAAIGMRAAEYPLGGAARDVIDDVHRLGGVAIATHPTSPRAELAWHGWDTPVDGVEWLNADSEWRDERRAALLRAAFAYLVRPAAALTLTFDRPAAALAKADALAADRPLTIVAGHDAHARIAQSGAEGYGSRGVPLPSYRALFASFAVRTLLDAPLAGDAAADATLVLRALKHGRVYTALDGLASPARLVVGARSGGAAATVGDRLIPAGPVDFDIQADAPAGSRIVLLHNGTERAAAPTPRLQYRANAAPGAYRVEVRLPDAPGDPPVPWIVASPLYVGLPTPVPAPAAFGPTARMSPAEWAVEHGATSAAVMSVTADGAELRYQLGARGTSPYAALVRPVSIPAEAVAVSFAARADRPMRVSVQMRSPAGGGEGQRWRRSIFIDGSSRVFTLDLLSFRPVRGATGSIQSSEITSLLFVADTVNTDPGASGSFEVSELGWRGAGR